LLAKQPDESVVQPCFKVTALGAAEYYGQGEIVSLLRARSSAGE